MVVDKAVFSILIVFLLAGSAFANKYSGGTGEPNNPYRIATPNDLNDIGNHPNDFNDCFILVNDINMAGFVYTTALIAPDTNSSVGFQGSPFTGLFDGNDHIIGNLTIDTAGADNGWLGLFGRIVGTAEVKNLGIEDVNITGGGASSEWVGSLVAENSGSISDCYATGTVSEGSEVGGLVGFNSGSISNCFATGSVFGYDDVSGLVGYNWNGSISQCYSTVSVSGDTTIGGLVGYNFSISQASILNCFAAGEVAAIADCAGGLVGYNNASISNCFAAGGVSGYDDVGGLVGYTRDGSISNCYAAGIVSGDGYVGGLVGYHHSGSYASCFWDQTVNPSLQGIGNTGKAGVSGKTTAQMQTESTYTDTGWDFVGETVNGPNDIWTIHEGQDYSKFVWLLVNFVGWYEVDLVDYSYFADHWLDTNCADSNDCNGTDLDFSGTVDWGDLKIFCDHWLQGTSY